MCYTDGMTTYQRNYAIMQGMAMTYRTKIKDLADNRGWTLRDIVDRTTLSRTTVNLWYYNAGEMSRLDAKVVIEFMRVFEVDDLSDIIHMKVFDSLTGDVVDPQSV